VSVDEAPIEMPELSADGFQLFATGQWGKNDFDGYLLDALPAHEPTGWGDDWFEVRWDGTTAVSIHVLRGDDAAATDRLAEALLRHCRQAQLGDGFALLQNDPDLAFVASVDPAVTDRFRSQLVEQGFTSAGSC
jgi:hypothetical protein